jgi:hypothetical protein
MLRGGTGSAAVDVRLRPASSASRTGQQDMHSFVAVFFLAGLTAVVAVAVMNIFRPE